MMRCRGKSMSILSLPRAVRCIFCLTRRVPIPDPLTRLRRSIALHSRTPSFLSNLCVACQADRRFLTDHHHERLSIPIDSGPA